MSEWEYGILHHRDTEPHRERMTEAVARAWIETWEEDGGKVGAFRIIRRTMGPWELVDETSAGDVAAEGARASSPAESPGAPVSGTIGAPSDEAVRRAYERVVAEVGEEALLRYLDAVRDDEDSVTPEELGYPDWYVDPEDDNKPSTGGAPEGESVGARIKREGEEARHVLLAQMAAEAVAADNALDGGDVGTYEVESSGGPIVVPGTSANSMRALRAMQAGVPVSLRHDTGEWTIEPRTPEEWAEWGRWEDDESSAGGAS